jgi:enoyl-CoA hydratase/carnithine racemase
MEDRIRLSVTDGIADVRLNRADKVNALDPPIFEAIADTAAPTGKSRRRHWPRK